MVYENMDFDYIFDIFFSCGIINVIEVIVLEFYYKDFRFSKLTDKKYRHLFYLLYWIVYGFFFFLLEKINFNRYFDMTTAFDRKIPFCEYFIVFYVLWYFYVSYVLIYTLFFDIDSFRKFSRFAMITYSVAIICYFIYPTVQTLRPETFARDNLFVSAVRFLYTIDTPTNVMPSVHVIGSLTALFTVWNAKGHNKPIIRAVFTILAVLIILSTLFLKQHAVVDIVSGVLVCIAAYFIVFYKKKKSVKA